MKSSGHAGGLLHRELPKPSKALAGVRSNDELQSLLLVSGFSLALCSLLYSISERSAGLLTTHVTRVCQSLLVSSACVFFCPLAVINQQIVRVRGNGALDYDRVSPRSLIKNLSESPNRFNWQ